MNIIKETLEKTFDELSKQISHQEVLRRTHLVNKANDIAFSIDDLFKEYTIQVTDRNIEFKLTEDSWYDFQIVRDYSYTTDTYCKATMSTSSLSNADGKGLKKLVCLGILAKHCLNGTNEWNELISLMDETNEIYKANIKSLWKQMDQIGEQLRKIKNEEQSNEFQNALNKNTFKLNKSVYFHYGNGRWDRICSDEFFWEANESGKTYTLSYIDEKTKRSINKRIKKVDIESFVKYNMNLILVEVAS
jgi:hypothetical protein